MRFGIRELIFFVVLLAVPVASFLYVFQPRKQDIELARSEIHVKEERLDRLAEVVNRIDDIGRAIEEGQEAIRMIEEKLPSEKHVEHILEQVWQVASRNGLLVKSVKGQKIVPAALYLELPLAMEMEGSFDGFYQFLLELENLQRITRIHNMKLERAQVAKGPQKDEYPEGWAKMSFTLSIYFQPEASAGASSDEV